MTTTRRIQYHQYGGPDVLRLEEFELRPPGPGEVLVRVHAAAANAMDWKMRKGELKMITGRKFPRGVGHDLAGVVEAIGAGVTRFRVGDEVLGAVGLRAPGAFSELVVVEAKTLVIKPGGVSFVEAAALPVVGLTALVGLTKVGKLQPGQAVFIAGCLGGVGRAAAQLALSRGASVAGSCRPSAAHDARELGIDPIVDFDFDPTPLRGRFDIVFDTSGALPIAVTRTLLKPAGRSIDIVPTAAKFVRSALPGPFHVMMANGSVEDLEQVARAAAEGVLRVPVARTVPLSKGIAALTELEENRAGRPGKLVIIAE